MMYRPNEPLGILVIDTTDRFGKRIILEKDRYENHIIEPNTGHKELAGNLEAIEESLTNPYLVLQSYKNPTRYLYYGKSTKSTKPWLSIKTVVDHMYDDFGFVVTSMFQRKITPSKEGTIIYAEEDKNQP